MTLARDVILGLLGDRSQPICSRCLSKLTKPPSARLADGWRVHCAECREMGEVLTRIKMAA